MQVWYIDIKPGGQKKFHRNNSETQGNVKFILATGLEIGMTWLHFTLLDINAHATGSNIQLWDNLVHVVVGCFFDQNLRKSMPSCIFWTQRVDTFMKFLDSNPILIYDIGIATNYIFLLACLLSLVRQEQKKVKNEIYFNRKL